MFKSHSKEGFSLIEVTGVVLIIALLVLYGTPDVLDKVSYTEDVMLQNNILVIEDYISYNNIDDLTKNEFLMRVDVKYLKDWIEEGVKVTSSNSEIKNIDFSNIENFYIINSNKVESYFHTKIDNGLFVYVGNNSKEGRVYLLKNVETNNI